MPFSDEQFFGVFASYNAAVWPAQIVLLAIAVTAGWLAVRHGDRAARWVWGALALLWLWTGVAYHLLHFTAINPAAYGFAALFAAQSALFFWRGAVRATLPLGPVSGIRRSFAVVFLLYALVLYPALGALAGHRYFASPTFGAPCPVVIYTFGLLLLTRHVPPWLVAVPTLWAVIGTSAVFSFGVLQDAMLPVTAAIVLSSLLYRRHMADAAQRPHA